MSPSVLDTSILIDVLRGSPEAIRYVAGLEEQPLCSEVTRTEVLRGVRSGERRTTEILLSQIDWRDVDASVSRRAGEFGRRYRRSHGMLGAADLLIAATADLVDGRLQTMNVRHFPMFAGLRPPY